MLHKSFKPAKCKTSLKLAASRIKLLKNKKEVQIKQVRREVAQLLESGQVQTARIRVEHAVREEKTMGAYELIEIYCELIAARLPIIESQKNCPIDLKEAIASVVFASPRCAEIPEFMDVQKHFLAKYGKDFISAAVELRPDCGVNRSLVEKLSATTPDGPTKLKILTTIAEEHNIKWDPSSFGGTEMTSRDDLLKGPSTFEKASRMHEQPPGVDAGYRKAANKEDLRNFHARTSFGGQNVPQSPDCVSSPVNPHLQTQSPANIGEGSMARHGRYSGDASVNYMGGPDWNMEFTDATAAAQAAAESAERASMAARAAAELSSHRRVAAHYAPDSHGFRDERVERPSGLRPPGKALPRTQVNNASVGGKSWTPDEHIDSREENIVGRGTPDAGSNQGDGRDDSDSLLGMTKKLHRDAYKKSGDRNNPDFRTAGGDENALVYEQQATGRNTETNPWSTELDNDCISDERSVRKNSFEEVNMGSSSKIHARKNSVESFVEKHGLSSLDDQKAEDGLAENPFAGDDEERISMGDKTTSEGAVVFDDYGSDEDVENVFDLDKVPKSSHASSLPHVEAHQSEDFGIPSPGRITTDSFMMSIAKPEEKLPVTFDDSDGLSSENEAEPEKSRAPRESEHGFGVRKSSRSSESVQEVVYDSGSRLAFGNLTGGRRNKSGAPPPYTQTASGEDSLLNRRRDDHGFSASDEDPDIHYGGIQSEGRPNRRTRTNPVSRKVTVPQPKTGSHPVVYADDDEEEFELEADYWKKPSTRPVANDVAEEHPSRPSSGKSIVGSVARLSRRTKAGIASTGELGNRRDAKDLGFSLRRADAGENSAKLSDMGNASDNSDGRLKWRSEVKDDDPVSEPAKAFGTKDAAGNSRPARPSLDSASREDSLTQSSHVHPKMPQDYETLLANLESLQGNRL